MYASYSFITYVLQTRPLFTPLAISWIDSMLPALFIYISYVESHVDEDDRQNSLLVRYGRWSTKLCNLLQLKLFVAKLLTSVIFNYVNLSVWLKYIAKFVMMAYSGPNFWILRRSLVFLTFRYNAIIQRCMTVNSCPLASSHLSLRRWISTGCSADMSCHVVNVEYNN